MPKAITEGLTAAHVRLALHDLDNGIEHPFGEGREYELIHEGKSYPPKAVVGIAFRHVNGTILPPEEFSGGEGSGQANSVLRKLGFTVRRKGNIDKKIFRAIEEQRLALENDGYFDPSSVTDERVRRLREIVQRQGQPQFRQSLLEGYLFRCAVTGCDAVWSLEAAHITPYLGPSSNQVANGLLLRSDIHTLFDLDLLGINPETMRIELGPDLQGTCYDEFSGKQLSLPENASNQPSKAALQERWKRFQTQIE